MEIVTFGNDDQWFDELDLPKSVDVFETGFICRLGYNRRLSEGGVTGVDIEGFGATREKAIHDARKQYEFLIN